MRPKLIFVKYDHVIEELSDNFFPFSFYLLEDELQALQLVVDVTTACMVESSEILQRLDLLENRLKIYKKLFDLAQKRRAQIQLEEVQISLKEKAALYLSEKVGISNQRLSLFLDIEEIELLQFISSARYKALSRAKGIESGKGQIRANGI